MNCTSPMVLGQDIRLIVTSTVGGLYSFYIFLCILCILSSWYEFNINILKFSTNTTEQLKNKNSHGGKKGSGCHTKDGDFEGEQTHCHLSKHHLLRNMYYLYNTVKLTLTK